MKKLSGILKRYRQRQLLSAARLFRAGRTRFIWLHGVFYCGGTFFLLYSVLDFFRDPHSRPGSMEMLRFLLATFLCLAGGYLYGALAWRQIERTARDLCLTPAQSRRDHPDQEFAAESHPVKSFDPPVP